MRPQSPTRWSCSGSRDGVALLLVLAFIVLLTILVVSFISYTELTHNATSSYSKSIQAQEIAQGGLQDILFDLHQEILAGSTVQNGGGYSPVYLPVTNWAAQPARFGYAAGAYSNDVSSALLPPTLIRVSRASQDGTPGDFYPTLPSYYTSGYLTNRASAANTATNSFNGRSITAARWAKIALLSTNSTIPPPFSTNTPDWVYVTRAGSRACVTTDVPSMRPAPLTNAPTSTATASPVIGRYAYAVYDEGALLDANVAGHYNAASSYSTTNQAILGAKAYLSYADLTQLPGLSGNQTIIDNLVKLRNASAGLSGSAASAQTNFIAAATTSAQNGYLYFTNNSTGTDTPFLGRQDLINYFASVDPSYGTATPTYSAALPYLGTFSRARTAPSWRPLYDATNFGAAANGSYAYRDIAETSTSVNRDLPNVRYANTGTVTHYNDNGSSYTYTVNAGDPLVQHRFSLAKLAWVTYEGPSADLATSDPLYNAAGTDAAVYACFGLVWDSSNSDSTYLCWVYNHSSATLPSVTSARTSNAIDTLGQVATALREPDFFELLKAGILYGSLGGNPGPVASVNPSAVNSHGTATGYGATGPVGVYFDYYSGEVDRHVRQIGVNIIDQVSANNYSTAIYQNLDTASVPWPEKDFFNTVFGVKNLPYLQRVWGVSYVPNGDTNNAADPEDVWIQPEVWNPNTSSTGLTNYVASSPTHLRLATFGWCNTSSSESGGTVSTPYSPPTNYVGVNFGSTPLTPLAQGVIPFLNPQTAKPTVTPPAFYDTPEQLTGYTAAGNNYQDTNAVQTVAGPQNYIMYDNTTAISRPLLGVWLGQVQRHSPSATYHTIFADPTDNLGNTGNLDPELTFALQYYGGDGNWHYYTSMSRLQELAWWSFSSHEIPGLTTPQRIYLAGRPDPRTDRFSASQGYFNSSGTTYNFGWGANQTIWPSDYSGNGYSEVNAGLSAALPQTSPTADFTYYNNTTGSPQGTGAFPGYQLGNWLVNLAGANTDYYQDNDGVIRPGDGWRGDYEPNATLGTGTYTAGGDGVLTYEKANFTTADTAVLNARARGVVMDRPYQSVGELGYVYRDLPFKTLDFWSPWSADSGLLDLFSAIDEPPIVSGELDVNRAPAPALQAVLNGTMKQQFASTVTGTVYPTTLPVISANTEANAIASAVSTTLWTNGPLNNRGDLVAGLSTNVFGAITSYQATVSTTDNPQDNKAYSEQYVRALAPVANTRTWDLLIDIIAQSGHMAPTAQGLNDFVVDGERRYWLHVALDRYTGKIVDQQLEPVYE